MTRINSCPITGYKLRPLLTLKQQPVFMGTTKKSPGEDEFHDMEGSILITELFI